MLGFQDIGERNQKHLKHLNIVEILGEQKQRSRKKGQENKKEEKKEKNSSKKQIRLELRNNLLKKQFKQLLVNLVDHQRLADL